jgi:LysR family transcriptional regulator, low CO2-responsive transcriptional regulator
MRQLRVFTAAAAQLSFARAAQELHLTPPAVSLQIAELERHAGAPLFDRLGKRLYLTKAGEALLRASRDIIDKMRLLEDELSAMSGVDGGVLNVGVISAGDYFLATLLAEFCKLHEGVRMALSVCNREELLRLLNGNGVDLAVMSVLPPRRSGLTAAPFAAHPIVIVSSTTHPLAGMRRLSLEAIAKERFIVREQGSQTRQVMNETLQRARIKPVIALETASNETIKQTVAAGFGIAFMSAHAIGYEVKERRLAVLDIEGLPIRAQWLCVHRRDKTLPAAARAFAQYLQRRGAGTIRRLVPACLRDYWADAE